MNAAQSFKRIFLKIPRASCPRIKIRDSFIAKEDGDVAVAMMLFMMMLCVLAVIGYDFSRAHTVRERLKTATDAAALAACMQAKQIPDSINIVMVNGQLKMIVPKWDMDLSDPDVQEAAAAAAAKAFSQNVLGTKMPLSMVATPPVAGLSPATSSAALPFQAAVDWNDPQQTASGITYYNKYVVSAGMAVKTMFTAGPFASSLFNNGIVKGSNYGQGWGGAIPINAVGEAQAMSENN